jgi:hypothetical protein
MNVDPPLFPPKCSKNPEEALNPGEKNSATVVGAGTEVYNNLGSGSGGALVFGKRVRDPAFDVEEVLA